MGWTERQLAMLREMGIRLWRAAAGAAAGQRSRRRRRRARGAAAPRAAQRRPPAAVAAASGAAAVLPMPARIVPPPSHAGLARAARRRRGLHGLQPVRSRAAQTVFGVGHPRAHWMIVGEAPGEQEDRQGEPFVGTAGQLLDNMLRALGLTRGDGAEPERQVYIANTLKCRPPRQPQPRAATSWRSASPS